MLSRVDTRKKLGEDSGAGKLLNDIETISKALHLDKNLPRSMISTVSSRSKSVGKIPLPESKPKAKNDKKDAMGDKDKKSSIWSWKGLKALTQVRNRRFNCCFSLQVHSVEGLPPIFDDLSLLVHWKRRDGELMTRPVMVIQGVAEFEEQLTHMCSIYGSRSGPHHSAKYEAKHFLLFASVYGTPNLDLGKHRVDLTRLLPLTLEELEEEKSSGKWTTSFRLSGKANGAQMHVSFGYEIIGDTKNGDSKNDVSESRNLRQHSTCTWKALGQIDQSQELSAIRRTGSLPARSSISEKAVEDIKDLHEVLPIPKSKLSESISMLYEKLDEEDLNTANEPVKPDVDVISDPIEPVKLHKHLTSDAGHENEENEFEVAEYTITDQGAELSASGHEKAIEDTEKAADVESIVAQVLPVESTIHHSTIGAELSASGHEKAIEDTGKAADVESIVAQVLPVESTIHHSTIGAELSASGHEKTIEDTGMAADVESTVDQVLPVESTIHHSTIEGQEDEVLASDPISQEADVYTKEALLKDLESALNNASDYFKEGSDSQEDEGESSTSLNHSELESSSTEHMKGKSLSLDDDSEIVASDFLDLLGIEHSPAGLSSESEPESPRERLLRQFEKDTLASGCSLFDFGIDVEEPLPKVYYDDATESDWGSFSRSFDDSSYTHTFEAETPKFRAEAMTQKPRASVLEDLETEVLMHEWGLNEKTFEQSPRSSSGFGSPIDLLPEASHPLPPLAEGLGPFVQTKDGGFLRSMNPALFSSAKSGGSLIMQVSSPVVMPAEMGSGVMDILQHLASVGIEKLSMQANKLMPLEDITGTTMQQIAWEAAPSLDGPQRQDFLQHEPVSGRSIPVEHGKSKAKTSRQKSKLESNATGNSINAEYVNLEDLAPLAMDKIEALSMEGLRIQSGMSDEDAPSNISLQSIGEFSALEGKRVNSDESLGLEGAGGLQLLDIKDSGGGVDGLMGLSLTLDEWMRLDSGEIEDGEHISEQTSRLLAAHHATSLESFRGRSKGEKRKGKGRNCGLLGNNFTVALMVQLRDPLRDYEPVGTPMLALIQVERVFVPPKPRIFCTVSQVRDNSGEEDDDVAPAKKYNNEEPKEEKVVVPEEEKIPQFKITEVHVSGLKTDPDKKKSWGSKTQQQSGSRWLLANGMGKKNKLPLAKSKAGGARSSLLAPSPETTTAQPGDSLWSISSRVYGTGAKWKELATLNPHIRNPNVILQNETIRLL